MRILESIMNQKLCEKKIFDAFPEKYYSDVERVLNVLSFKDLDEDPLDKSLHVVTKLMSEESIPVNLSNGKIKIPARIYFEIPKYEIVEKMTSNQKMIINCIFSRSNDGYERQKRIKELLLSSSECAAIYTLSLVGDYVIEILQEINRGLITENLIVYQQLINKNKKYWESIKSRNISYWNEYYRYPNNLKLNEYIGTEIIQKIEGKKI